jgi:hypothetical protein
LAVVPPPCARKATPTPVLHRCVAPLAPLSYPEASPLELPWHGPTFLVAARSSPSMIRTLGAGGWEEGRATGGKWSLGRRRAGKRKGGRGEKGVVISPRRQIQPACVKSSTGDVESSNHDPAWSSTGSRPCRSIHAGSSVGRGCRRGMCRIHRRHLCARLELHWCHLREAPTTHF